MDKQTFIAIVQDIVAGFEDAGFQSSFAEAQANGDVPAMMALPAAIQNKAFETHGCADSAAFKNAGRTYASDPAVAALLGRMKAALK